MNEPRLEWARKWFELMTDYKDDNFEGVVKEFHQYVLEEESDFKARWKLNIRE